jgi:hypothetical protein
MYQYTLYFIYSVENQTSVKFQHRPCNGKTRTGQLKSYIYYHLTFDISSVKYGPINQPPWPTFLVIVIIVETFRDNTYNTGYDIIVTHSFKLTTMLLPFNTTEIAVAEKAPLNETKSNSVKLYSLRRYVDVQQSVPCRIQNLIFAPKLAS